LDILKAEIQTIIWNCFNSVC